MKKPQQYCDLLRLGLSLTMVVLALPTGSAADNTLTPESPFLRFCMQDYLFGDWGGVRTKLKDHGVDFEFVYFGAVPSNVGGGIKEGSVYEGALMMLLDLDSAKL